MRTVGSIEKNLDSMTPCERRAAIQNLEELFLPSTRAAVAEFRQGWQRFPSLEEFEKAEIHTVRLAIIAETSDLAAASRELQAKPAFGRDTIVPDK